MPKKEEPPPKGLRIQLKGLHSTTELRAMLNEAVDNIEALNVQWVRGTNLYTTLCDKEAAPVYPENENGKRISLIVLENPYRSVADEHKA